MTTTGTVPLGTSRLPSTHYLIHRRETPSTHRLSTSLSPPSRGSSHCFRNLMSQPTVGPTADADRLSPLPRSHAVWNGFAPDGILTSDVGDRLC